MKKYLTTAIVVLLSTLLTGQTLLFEDFTANQMPPSGWSINGYPSQWSTKQTNNAGGTYPEAMFTWVSATSTSRLITSTIDVSAYDQVTIRFRHALDDYSGTGYSIGAAVSLSGGGWNTFWQVSPNTNISAEEVEVNLDVSVHNTLILSFFVTGNFYNLDYWYIDNIEVFSPYTTDASLTSLDVSNKIPVNKSVEGTIRNEGLSTISSLTINWKTGNDEIHSTDFTGLNIPYSQTFDFTCDGGIYKPAGTYGLEVWIENVNGSPDQNSGNDMISKTIQVLEGVVVPKIPIFEEFTSSTCPPCATFNTSFVPWAETNHDDITLLKYQMDWPGNGDPYYTAEGGVRKSFYGVSWVPWLVADGSTIDTDMGLVQNAYNNAQSQTGMVKICSGFYLSGTNMTINSHFLPLTDISNVRIQVGVFEKVTTENTGTNGETEFHHVMMKMVPNASGTIAGFSEGVPYTLNQSVNLAGTNIEEFSDLGVVIFLQDNSTKQIYQSAYAEQNAVLTNNANLESLYVNGEPVVNFDPEVINYNVELPFGTVDIPEVFATSQDEQATVVFNSDFSLPGSVAINVYSSDFSTINTYTVNLSVSATYYLDLTVLLEGPFNGFGMNTKLNQAGLIPLSQPYNASPWNYTGTENVTTIPNSDIVDWLLIEVRDASLASGATASTTIARKAVFVKKNGKVVSMDGSSMPAFDIPFSENIFVVIRHRNHLDIMSNHALQNTEGVFEYNFSTSVNQIYGEDAGCSQLGSNTWAMSTGDPDGNNTINSNDIDVSWYLSAGNSGYSPADLNLNGQTDNRDKDDSVVPKIGKSSQVPE